MKLKNKRTREIIDVELKTIEYPNSIQGYPVYNSYNSLAELNEEWEDVSEEPKGHWYLNYMGDVLHTEFESINPEKKIGNYFETKEEAERAVEKLKAWKRLKDNGFKFDEWERDKEFSGDYIIKASDYHTCDDKDLDLVFTEEDGDV